MATHTIVGLGNPGSEYDKTRHNTGRMFLDYVVNKEDATFREETKKPKYRYSKIKIENHTAILLQPDTFMNASGSAVAHFVKNKKDAGNTIVVYDDLDLPFGTIKISYGRSSGGHNGVESIIRALKTRDFVRIRVGVSRASTKGKAIKPVGEEKVLKLLLGKFTPDELKKLQKLFAEIYSAVELCVTRGREVAMSQFN